MTRAVAPPCQHRSGAVSQIIAADLSLLFSMFKCFYTHSKVIIKSPTQYYTRTCHVSTRGPHLGHTVEDDGPALGEGGTHPADHGARPRAVVRLRPKTE